MYRVPLQIVESACTLDIACIHHFYHQYAQLKSVLSKHVELKHSMDGNELQWNVNLPQSAPHSLTAKEFSMDQPDSMYVAINKLYQKYIDSRNAVLMVNLSYQVRRELENHLNSIECNMPNAEGPVHSNTNVVICESIMSSLEACIVEVCRLMNDSYYRFRRTPVFTELTKVRSASM